MKSLRKFRRPIHPKCILNSATSYHFSHCLRSSVHVCISLLSDLLLPFSLSPFPRLISPQQADHPLPFLAQNLPTLLISLRMKSSTCPIRYAPRTFFIFLISPPLLLYFYLLLSYPSPLTWEAFTASIYHHLEFFPWNVCLDAFLLMIGSHYKDTFVKCLWRVSYLFRPHPTWLLSLITACNIRNTFIIHFFPLPHWNVSSLLVRTLSVWFMIVSNKYLFNG